MVNKQLKRGDGDGGVRPGPASERVICLHTLRNVHAYVLLLVGCHRWWIIAGNLFVMIIRISLSYPIIILTAPTFNTTL